MRTWNPEDIIKFHKQAFPDKTKEAQYTDMLEMRKERMFKCAEEYIAICGYYRFAKRAKCPSIPEFANNIGLRGVTLSRFINKIMKQKTLDKPK